MPRIKINADFDNQGMHDEIDGMQRRARDFRPVFRKIREELRTAWSANYMSNGLAVGGWAPLDAEYAAWKATRFPGTPPMIQTGRLFRSISSINATNVEMDRKSVRFSLPDIRYAKFHEYGTTKMPKREMIFEPVGAAKQWAEWMAKHVNEGLGLRRRF